MLRRLPGLNSRNLASPSTSLTSDVFKIPAKLVAKASTALPSIANTPKRELSPVASAELPPTRVTLKQAKMRIVKLRKDRHKKVPQVIEFSRETEIQSSVEPMKTVRKDKFRDLMNNSIDNQLKSLERQLPMALYDPTRTPRDSVPIRKRVTKKVSFQA